MVETLTYRDVYGTPSPDTYDVAGTTGRSQYRATGDEELRAWHAEQTLGTPYDPTLDWANPGCQSKDKYGPELQ